MKISIGNVKSIKTRLITVAEQWGWRDLIITDESGREVEITLFAEDDPSRLHIQHEATERDGDPEAAQIGELPGEGESSTIDVRPAPAVACAGVAASEVPW